MRLSSSTRNASVAIAALSVVAACGGSSSLPGAQGAAGTHKVRPATTSIIYRFRGAAHGAYPFGGLLYLNGMLYGTTDGGGNSPSGGDGTVFKMTTSGRITTLYNFQGGNDGVAPEGVALIVDSHGDLFGTTNYGGGSSACNYGGCGTVFELVPHGAGYTERVLYAFQGGDDGSVPEPGVILGSDGSLYGTTVEGGNGPCPGEASGIAGGCGVVFKLTPSGSSYIESVIHEFQGGSDGIGPRGTLLMDASGALYGTTSYGGGASGCSSPSGQLGCGTVYKLTSSGSSYNETILHDFQGADGSLPRAALLPMSGGVLIGAVTRGGAYNHGAIYKLTPSGSGYTESLIYSFDVLDGAAPSDDDGLIADGRGDIYGTTVSGGEYTKHNKCLCGTVFELSPSGSAYSETVLYKFTGQRNRDGTYPHTGLTFDSSGNLYGVTFGGGLYKNGEGTVFRVTP
jgi:uncharacterized repeat protein (TIGR03803 family)